MLLEVALVQAPTVHLGVTRQAMEVFFTFVIRLLFFPHQSMMRSDLE
jgi:hypothetical protein